jgi:hypothetical protein
MWAVSPKQAKLIKKVMDDYAKQNGITPWNRYFMCLKVQKIACYKLK